MNKKESRTVLGILIVLALAAPLPAAAQERGLYLGGSIGQAEFRNSCGAYTGTCDPKDTAYRLFGGYHFSPNMALEVGYANLADLFVDGFFAGTAIPVSFEATAKALDVSVLPTLPLSDAFAIFGRIGIYRSQLEVRGLGATTGTESEHNGGWTLGAGLRFDLGRAFAVRAEWQRYNNIGGGNTGEDDIDYLNLGLMLRF